MKLNFNKKILFFKITAPFLPFMYFSPGYYGIKDGHYT